VYKNKFIHRPAFQYVIFVLFSVPSVCRLSLVSGTVYPVSKGTELNRGTLSCSVVVHSVYCSLQHHGANDFFFLQNMSSKAVQCWVRESLAAVSYGGRQ
jgi:hypothetical protein